MKRTIVRAGGALLMTAVFVAPGMAQSVRVDVALRLPDGVIATVGYGHPQPAHFAIGGREYHRRARHRVAHRTLERRHDRFHHDLEREHDELHYELQYYDWATAVRIHREWHRDANYDHHDLHHGLAHTHQRVHRKLGKGKKHKHRH